MSTANGLFYQLLRDLNNFDWIRINVVDVEKNLVLESKRPVEWLIWFTISYVCLTRRFKYEQRVSRLVILNVCRMT